MPRYAHIFVIMEENQSLDDIIGKPFTPNLTRLARRYGLATRYYGVVHPSEGNYVAMLGGDTFGIHDDDAYFCKSASAAPVCKHASDANYPDHTVDQPNLGGQLATRGLTWKAYEESIPAPGATDVTYPTPNDAAHRPAALYASKHNGWMNFASIQSTPHRADHIVDFTRLQTDIASGDLPSFAQIVPNQCNDMHGLKGANVPSDCTKENEQGRIARGDAFAGKLVANLMQTAAWHQPGNTAIVIVFDEGGHHSPPGEASGCCGSEPGDPSNSGGGHALCIVITNHGPRGVVDPTPYNHYGLLRTIEDAFGIGAHLRHAGDTAKGVNSMTPLFAVAQ